MLCEPGLACPSTTRVFRTVFRFDRAHRALIQVTVVVSIVLLGLVGPTADAASAHHRPTINRAVHTGAHEQIGKPYRWGAAGPSAFDCSGLVHHVFRKAGAPNLSRMTARHLQSSAVTVPVRRENLRRGDLVFYGRPATHVGIYVGDGYMIDASASQKRVVKRRPWGTPTSYGRIRHKLL